MISKQPDFYPLSMASEKYHIMPDNILNDWLDHKVPLYIRLDALPCRIVRYIGGDNFLLKHWKQKIKSGVDYYQHEAMPEFKIRQFYPEKNAEIEAQLLKGDLGLCRYTYNGLAHGYWRVSDHALKPCCGLRAIAIMLSANRRSFVSCQKSISIRSLLEFAASLYSSKRASPAFGRQCGLVSTISSIVVM